ncbi:hypothetical protein RFI_05020 [Reticulomyxa filosa]|uniref:Uncharacterized protein n=1 Tax=Reticulomyxa filosa TaxID=46433 RepID=X6P1T2_RETFI|nr:hypothetical protein RFI_05020 [Reticulomyxa filosa]|eukprot:ETO32098.1 hypothetical protein RFI_05020 [Reticulomyxa filosa]
MKSIGNGNKSEGTNNNEKNGMFMSGVELMSDDGHPTPSMVSSTSSNSSKPRSTANTVPAVRAIVRRRDATPKTEDGRVGKENKEMEESMEVTSKDEAHQEMTQPLPSFAQLASTAVTTGANAAEKVVSSSKQNDKDALLKQSTFAVDLNSDERFGRNARETIELSPEAVNDNDPLPPPPPPPPRPSQSTPLPQPPQLLSLLQSNLPDTFHEDYRKWLQNYLHLHQHQTSSFPFFFENVVCTF